MKKTTASCPNALLGFAPVPFRAETLTFARHAKFKPSLSKRLLFVVLALTLGFPCSPQLIAQAHARNIRIIGATLTPFEDTFKVVNPPLDYYYSPEKEKTRQAVNKWIRESKEYDGVIDFDALARDPERPSHIQAAFDSGDHLHPGDSGYKAMADSIDLKMLTTQP